MQPNSSGGGGGNHYNSKLLPPSNTITNNGNSGGGECFLQLLTAINSPILNSSKTDFIWIFLRERQLCFQFVTKFHVHQRCTCTIKERSTPTFNLYHPLTILLSWKTSHLVCSSRVVRQQFRRNQSRISFHRTRIIHLGSGVGSSRQWSL